MSFPGSPRVMKGAIVGLDPMNPLASIIIFQYNPDTMTRSIEPQTASGGSKSEPLRLKGAPIETISVVVEIDAADQLETNDPLANAFGIYPQLSALEMLVYPKTATVIANTVLAFAGTIEILQPDAPMTLFIWGPKRVLPVRINSISIAEEEYDTSLNPIRAKVTLGLRVMSTNDFGVTDPGYYIFMAHQAIKEAMATVSGVASAAMAVDVSVNVGL